MKTIKITDPARLRPLMTGIFEAVRADLMAGPVEVEIKRPSKSRDTEKKYHCLINDIARTVEIDGRKYDREVWKALMVDSFSEEMKRQGTPLAHPGRVVPSLDGMRVVTIRASTARFRQAEANAFIEFLYSEGIEMGATFSDPAMEYYQEICR